MAKEQDVVSLRITTTKLNSQDPTPNDFETQLQDALDAQQSVSGGDWALIEILRHNVSANYTDYVLVFEKTP